MDKVTDKWYVTMTDDFMSGWGMARGKVNKLVLECDTLQEAESVERYARSRSDMTYISIRNTKPYYNKSKFYTSYKTREDYPFWYEQG